MVHGSRRAGSRARLLIVCSMLLGALALPASAAAGEAVFTTFHFELNDSCVWGEGPTNTQLTVRLKGANGSFQGKFKTTTNGDGDWSGCFWGDIDAGDLISATDGSTSRTITARQLKFTIDRATDVVSGTSVPNDEVTFYVWDCNSNWNCQFATERVRSTSGNGSFSTDFTGDYNIRGGDEVEVDWVSPQGDVQWRFLNAPQLGIWVGNNEAWGTARPRQAAKVWLLDSNGTTERAQFEDRADAWEGDFESTFVRNGNAVDVEVGDWLVSNIASDLEFQVPNFNPSFNKATDDVAVRCFKNQLFSLYVVDDDNSSSMYTTGHANSNGMVFINTMSAGGFDLKTGDVVDLECLTRQGDFLEVTFEVP